MVQESGLVVPQTFSLMIAARAGHTWSPHATFVFLRHGSELHVRQCTMTTETRDHRTCAATTVTSLWLTPTSRITTRSRQTSLFPHWKRAAHPTQSVLIPQDLVWRFFPSTLPPQRGPKRKKKKQEKRNKGEEEEEDFEKERRKKKKGRKKTDKKGKGAKKATTQHRSRMPAYTQKAKNKRK